MYKYKCVFNFGVIHRLDGKPHEVTHDSGLHDFAGGFWIDDDLKFVKGSAARYWIPPSQILYIEKTRKESK